MKVFTIYDAKAEAYMQPFYAKTRGLAIRMVVDAASDSGHQFAKYASDYTLFEIGQFDEATGFIECFTAKVPIGTVLDLKTS